MQVIDPKVQSAIRQWEDEIIDNFNALKASRTASIFNAWKAKAITKEVATHDLLALGYSLHSIQQILGE